MGPGINVCGMVGHCAIRFYVMGERAVDEPEVDPRDLWPTRQRYTTDSLLNAEGTGLRRPGKFDGFHGELLEKPIQWEDGYIIPPTEPGLGVVLNEAVAEKYMMEE